jgi:hypothetical protein
LLRVAKNTGLPAPALPRTVDLNAILSYRFKSGLSNFTSRALNHMRPLQTAEKVTVTGCIECSTILFYFVCRCTVIELLNGFPGWMNNA